jgi:2-oxoglutarate ferredoxin oxidoreductase subunit beta
MELNDIIKPENLVYEKPRLMNENPMHYCPGCSHGVIHKLIAEVIADMGLEDKTIGISPVGCAVFAYNYLDIDWIEAAHGRAPAIASAVKRLNSRIKEMVTWRLSVRPRRFMQPTVARIS